MAAPCWQLLVALGQNRASAQRARLRSGAHMSAERPIAALARTAATVQEQAVRAQDFDAAVICRDSCGQLLAFDSEWARLEVLKKEAIFTQEFAGAAEIKAGMDSLAAQADEVAKKLPSSILLASPKKQLPEPLPLEHATADPAVKGGSDSPLLVLIDKHETIMANAVARQDFELAGKCKSLLEELTRLQAEWAPQDLQKKDAIETEDFERAEQLRHSMDELVSRANLAVEPIQQHAARAPTKAGLAARNGRQRKQAASDQVGVANRGLGGRTQAERLASLATPAPPARLSRGSSSKSIGSTHPLDRPLDSTLSPFGARPKPAAPRPLPKSGAPKSGPHKAKGGALTPMERVQRQMEQRARAATLCAAGFRGLRARAQERRRHAAATVAQMAWRRRHFSLRVRRRVLRRQETEREAADTVQG